jgi:hypothetical protein
MSTRRAMGIVQQKQLEANKRMDLEAQLAPALIDREKYRSMAYGLVIEVSVLKHQLAEAKAEVRRLASSARRRKKKKEGS